jgi:hypothetical protein
MTEKIQDLFARQLTGIFRASRCTNPPLPPPRLIPWHRRSVKNPRVCMRTHLQLCRVLLSQQNKSINQPRCPNRILPLKGRSKLELVHILYTTVCHWDRSKERQSFYCSVPPVYALCTYSGNRNWLCTTVQVYVQGMPSFRSSTRLWYAQSTNVPPLSHINWYSTYYCTPILPPLFQHQ